MSELEIFRVPLEPPTRVTVGVIPRGATARTLSTKRFSDETEEELSAPLPKVNRTFVLIADGVLRSTSRVSVEDVVPPGPVALRLMLKVPSTNEVPEIFPVTLSSVRPLGNEPEVI